jgi:predicted small secreted protein
MKTIIFSFLIAASILTACKGKSGSGDAQSTPAGLANMIFDAAKSGDYSKLKSLCDASLDQDVDSKKLCEVADGDEKLKTMFKEYFSKGKVVGEPTIEGDAAKVNILFGPDGTKEETFNMQKKDGKWFIMSF